jgi:hypothetical protein
VQRLDTDMAGAGVKMGLKALADGLLGAPCHHGVEEAVTAAAGEVVVAEAEALPILAIVRCCK